MQTVETTSSSPNSTNAVLADGWIPVAEKLPPEHEKVLVQFGDQNILIGIMDSNDQWAIFWSDGLKADDPDRPID
ncbi:hypothetical protein HRG84_23665 [Flavisolibacter sp. BT320]|nr:hypothetical protein [Flavisolibacter longurius]